MTEQLYTVKDLASMTALAKDAETVNRVMRQIRHWTNSDVLRPFGPWVTKQSWLERWLTSLWSPQWPEQYLGAIDRTMAQQGGRIYLTYCMVCHTVLENRTDPNRQITAQMWPLPYIGTDPLTARNFVVRASSPIRTGKIQGRPANYVAGDPLPADATGGQVLTHATVGILVRKPLEGIGAVISSLGTSLPAVPSFDPISYRARPLNGVWATAPYLHNGSVPNLWELLQLSSQRVPTFNVGNREFDPVNVGFVTTVPPDGNSTLFDTSEPGNSNAGHEYGAAQLTDPQKWALIEYIKSL